MRYVRVKVKRDTNTMYNRSVPEWEIPILEFIFEAGNVEVTDEFETLDRALPDAAYEFDRLVRAYGSDPQSGVPYAASVYGQERAGVKALAEAMRGSSEADEPAPPTRARGRSRKAAEADPLNV